jgi:hypothetical protein
LINWFQAVKIKIRPKAFVLPPITPKKSRNMSQIFLVGIFFFVAESPKYNFGRFCTDQVELHGRRLLRFAYALGGFALRLFLSVINPLIVALRRPGKPGLVISRLFSIKRSYVILLLEQWRKVSIFPSGSNYTQPPFFPGLEANDCRNGVANPDHRPLRVEFELGAVAPAPTRAELLERIEALERQMLELRTLIERLP